MSYNKSRDFNKYYCRKTQNNVWVLGYFGGGSINFAEFKKVAEDFSKEVGVPIETVNIDEIFTSSRFKGFKYIMSGLDSQSPIEDAEHFENLWGYLSY